jgi:putative MFS transporter
MNGGNAPTLAARLDSLPVSRWHLYMIVICVLSTIFDGLDGQVIGPILPKLIAEWKITNAQVGLLGSAGFAGMAVGSTLFGVLADAIGRLKVFAITLFWYSVLSGICALTGGFKSLFVMRFIVGMGLGGLIPVAITYLSEYIPSKRRGHYMAYPSIGFQLGTVLAFTVGFTVVVPYGWRWGFLLGVIPAFLTPFLWKGLPESVRYLLNKGRAAEAVNVVEGLEQRILGKATVPTEQAVEIERRAAREEAKARYRDLFQGGLAKTTVMLSLLWFAMIYNSYSITVWLPIFMVKELKYALGRGLAFLALSALVGIVGYLVAGFICDRWGRKKSVIFSFLLYGIDLYFLFSFGRDPTVGTLFLCLMFFANGGMWVSLYAYTPESFPTKVRATSTGFVHMFGRIGGVFGPAVVGLTYARGGIFGVLHVNMALLVLAIVVMLILGKETKGKTLEQIAQQRLQAATG